MKKKRNMSVRRRWRETMLETTCLHTSNGIKVYMYMCGRRFARAREREKMIAQILRHERERESEGERETVCVYVKIECTIQTALRKVAQKSPWWMCE
jgi:hypothetical protein